jgi:TusA-related sulfurtransferase
MLELDLRAYKCPQQFIQFKLGLREAISLNQTITFNISREQNTDDIERYLQKKCIITS